MSGRSVIGSLRLHPPPASARTATVDGDPPLLAELVEHEAHRRRTDSWQSPLDVSTTELGGRLLEDVGANTILFAAHGVASLVDPLLEIVVGAGQDAGEVGDPRADGVLAGVPSLLGLVEPGVVRVLGFLDALLETDVAGDAVALRQELVGGEQPGEATIAIGHRVDGQDVEDQGADEDQRVSDLGTLGRVVPVDGLAQEELGLLWLEG